MESQMNIDPTVYSFFGITPPTEGNGNKKEIDKEITDKIGRIIDSLSILYDALPAGQAIALRFIHGRVILASPSEQEQRKVGQLIVSKPVGVLELSTQGGQ